VFNLDSAIESLYLKKQPIKNLLFEELHWYQPLIYVNYFFISVDHPIQKLEYFYHFSPVAFSFVCTIAQNDLKDSVDEVRVAKFDEWIGQFT
jgi:hypothetical protein